MARRIVLLALALSCATAAEAVAQVRTIESRGLWTAFEGTGPDQVALCGIATAGGDRQISISQSAGETGLIIAFDKNNWEIPDGTAIPVSIQIDGRAQPGLNGRGSGQKVSAELQFALTIGLMRALRQGSQIRIDFPSGNEPYWSGGLSGTSAAIDAFNACRGRFAAATTQPLAPPPAAPSPTAAPASQPFVSPPPPPLAMPPSLPVIPTP